MKAVCRCTVCSYRIEKNSRSEHGLEIGVAMVTILRDRHEEETRHPVLVEIDRTVSG